MYFNPTKLKHFRANFLFFVKKVNCADSCVGDARVRGISGGEKKRLSLACELIVSPSIIFADEPTTGEHDIVSRIVTVDSSAALYFWFGIIIYVHVLASLFYISDLKYCYQSVETIKSNATSTKFADPSTSKFWFSNLI